jgi:hypothetical protein
MGDEEGLDEEDSGHYESMVFNLLTGNQQGYQVLLWFHLLIGKKLVSLGIRHTRFRSTSSIMLIGM